MTVATAGDELTNTRRAFVRKALTLVSEHRSAKGLSPGDAQIMAQKEE